MKIGQTFKYRRSGAHEDVTLIILRDEFGRKHLFDLDYNIRIGEAALLNATPDRVFTKQEIRQAIKDAIERAEAEREQREKQSALMDQISEINERIKKEFENEQL